MVFRLYVSIILLAALALASPITRAEPNLALELTNTALNATSRYSASTDGSPVLVDSAFPFDFATVQCLEVCVPEYHCILYDESMTEAVATLNPGTTGFASSEIGQIICGFGLQLAAET